jgi:hypothetical protein
MKGAPPTSPHEKSLVGGTPISQLAGKRLPEQAAALEQLYGFKLEG